MFMFRYMCFAEMCSPQRAANNKENEQKDIGHFNNIELASVLCDFFYMDVTGTNNFCNNLPETNPNSTIEILSYARN